MPWRGIDNGPVLWTVSVSLAVAFSSFIRVEFSQELEAWLIVTVGLSSSFATWLLLLGILLSAAILVLPFRLFVERAVACGYRYFAPREIAEQFPKILSGVDNATPRPVLDAEARRLFDRYLIPAFPGLKKEHDRLLSTRESQIDESWQGLLNRLTERWTSSNPWGEHHPIQPSIRLTDPIHGTVSFEQEYHWLLTHPIIQRLHEVRQLMFAFPVFPGGTHTRFHHSVGVAYLAREAMRRVVTTGKIYTPDGTRGVDSDERSEAERWIRIATVAGLVHDAAHTALGHGLDRFYGSRYLDATPTDKQLLPRMLEGPLQPPIDSIPGVSVEAVRRVLLGQVEEDVTGWERFVADLLDSALDVDRMDYLLRDAHYTGQREGLVNKEALLSSIRPFETGDTLYLSFDETYLSHVEQFVYARDAMYLRCYEHPAKIVSEWIATRAVDSLFKRLPSLQDRLYDFTLLTDAQLIEFVSLVDEGGEAIEALRGVFHSSALTYCEIESVPLRVGSLSGKLGRLRDAFSMNESWLLDVVIDLEKDLAKAVGLDPEHLILTLPISDVADDRADDNIRVLHRTTSGGYETVNLLGDRRESDISDLLTRSQFVPRHLLEDIDNVDDLQRILRTATGKGISMLEILRSARSKLRLFAHSSVVERQDEIRKAFHELGVVDEDHGS